VGKVCNSALSLKPKLTSHPIKQNFLFVYHVNWDKVKPFLWKGNPKKFFSKFYVLQ